MAINVYIKGVRVYKCVYKYDGFTYSPCRPTAVWLSAPVEGQGDHRQGCLPRGGGSPGWGGAPEEERRKKGSREGADTPEKWIFIFITEGGTSVKGDVVR